MSKKLFVLFSLAQTFTPQLFKSKATVAKHIQKNRNLEYKEFDSVKQANQFIAKLSKRNQATMPQVKENILDKTIQQQNYEKHFSIETKKQRIQRLQKLRKLEKGHTTLNHKETDIGIIKNKKIIQNSKSKAINKQEPINKIKMQSQKNFQLNLLAHQNTYGFKSDELINRLTEYLRATRNQSFTIFTQKPEQSTWKEIKQLQTAQKHQSGQKYPKDTKVNIHSEVIIQDKTEIHAAIQLKAKQLNTQNLQNSTIVSQQTAKDNKIDTKGTQIPFQKVESQVKQAKQTNLNEIQSVKVYKLGDFNKEIVKQNLGQTVITKVKELEQQYKPIKSRPTQQTHPIEKFQLANEVKFQQISIKIQEVEKPKQSTRIGFQIQQHQQLYSLMRKLVPFYKITTLSTQDMAKINQSQQIQIETKIFRRQNPGYASVHYSIKSASAQIYSRNFPLGVKKEDEDQIYGLACTLNDLYFSGVRKGISIYTKSAVGERNNLQRFSNSIDCRIRKASSLLLTMKDKLASQTFSRSINQAL